MAEKARSYQLPWQFNSRILSEHLGSQKYSTSVQALAELVANAFDADATLVDIEVETNDLGALQSIIVSDNGHGISPQTLRDRFVIVAVAPDRGVDTHLGRFGVGRLAVYRIGSVSDWTSVSHTSSGARVGIRFTLRSDNPGGPLTIEERGVDSNTPTGTRIAVFNVLDSSGTLTPARIASHLLAQFCSYLLAHPTRQLRIQGEAINVTQLVQTSETEPVSEADVPSYTINHLLLSRPVDHSRFPDQLLFAAKGRTVATSSLEDFAFPHYLGLVDCSYLDSIVTSNRESLIEMDSGFARLSESAIKRAGGFHERQRAQQARRFIERARLEEYYPYRDALADSLTAVSKAIYDVTLEKLNESANVERMTKRQQEVVFKLLRRTLDNENLLPVLHEIAHLSDTDIEKFRKVLERTTLDAIIRLATEVTGRLTFLDALHDLVYSEDAVRLRERSQLHRILEPHCWIFGPKYHLAASDRSFREVVRRHRELAGLDPVVDDVVAQITGVNDIPDLFLAATRDYPLDPPNVAHHHLIIELKRPAVAIGLKELEQLRRYARTIIGSNEFDKHSTHWDLYVVSSEIADEVQIERNQKGRDVGVVGEWSEVTAWVFSWGEIIQRARDEMRLVREHLQMKSQELRASDYLRESFPDILSS